MSLASSIWFGVLLTLGIWEVAVRLYHRARSPLLNPVGISIAAIILILSLTHVDYAQYDIGGRWLSFLLGPAVVALAVPLYRQLDKVRANLPAILLSTAAGSLVGLLSAVGLVAAFHGSHRLAIAMAPKSVTTPIAMGIVEQVGHLEHQTQLEPLTAALVILTGILGAMIGPQLLQKAGVRSPFAWGLAVGTAAHGIGTARAVDDHPLAGAAAGIGMAMNGIITAFTLPYLLPPILRLLGM